MSICLPLSEKTVKCLEQIFDICKQGRYFVAAYAKSVK